MIVLAIVVDLHDARMNEPSYRLGFVAEADDQLLQVDRVERRLYDCLDRDPTRNLRVETFKDRPHGPLAEHFADFIFADFLRLRHHSRSGGKFGFGRRLEGQPYGKFCTLSNLRFDIDATAVILDDLV